MKPKFFIVFGLQRTGTNLVHQYLALHPEVAIFPEELAMRIVTSGVSSFINASAKHVSAVRNDIDRASLLSLAEIAKDAAASTPVASGLKFAITPEVDIHPFFSRLFELFHDVHVIHVVRQDLVAKFASLQRAAQTGVWVARADSQSDQEAVRLDLDTEEFWDFAKLSLDADATIASLCTGKNYLEVDYERDIAPNDPARLAGLFDFLGLQKVELEFPIRKVAPTELSQFVKNLDAVREIEAKVKSNPEVSTPRSLVSLMRKALGKLGPRKAWRRLSHPFGRA